MMKIIAYNDSFIDSLFIYWKKLGENIPYFFEVSKEKWRESLVEDELEEEKKFLLQEIFVAVEDQHIIGFIQFCQPTFDWDENGFKYRNPKIGLIRHFYFEAVRYDEAISKSQGYKIGYEWAQKQNLDYLRQHFGLYFDQWNDDGMGSLSSNDLNRLNRNLETDPILEDIVSIKKMDSAGTHSRGVTGSLSNRKSMLAGILTAVKEASVLNQPI